MTPGEDAAAELVRHVQAASSGLDERIADFVEGWPGLEERDQEHSLESFFHEVVFDDTDELPVTTTFDEQLEEPTAAVVISGGTLEQLRQRPVPAMCVDVDWREVSEQSLREKAEEIYRACRRVAEALDGFRPG